MNSLSRRRVATFVADELANGESVRRLAKVLAAYLAETHQTRAAALLILDIESALLERHHHLAADVVSAREISAELRGGLIKKLKLATRAETVELLEEIDPGLIGGVIVRTPDAELDASIRRKLIKLRQI
ncbi:MAG: F0F1 ATP synthase subunit delta [Candidatus Nomurabacteria bacterium]|jgi:F0F1-type ATP synthase delta subunit|nr:F0F1 ATP synthase subunit delta [Candidatus Nomurabacteria bacterium]